MIPNKSLNVYYLYEYLRKHSGRVSDSRLVKRFKFATSDEIFLAKCLFEDYKKNTICWQTESAPQKQKNQCKCNTKNKLLESGEPNGPKTIIRRD